MKKYNSFDNQIKFWYHYYSQLTGLFEDFRDFSGLDIFIVKMCLHFWWLESDLNQVFTELFRHTGRLLWHNGFAINTRVVLMVCTPLVPFLAHITLSVGERYMYFVTATITPLWVNCSVFANLSIKPLSSRKHNEDILDKLIFADNDWLVWWSILILETIFEQWCQN